MRRIYKIAKAELATLFYSPVAWFILVVFSFQVGMQFIDLIGEQAQANTLGYSWGFFDSQFVGRNERFVHGSATVSLSLHAFADNVVDE